MNRTLGLLLAGLLVCGSAEAKLYIEISKAIDTALPIAVVPFASPAHGKAVEDVAAIISADLARSGRFNPMSIKEMPERPHEGNAIRFSLWRSAHTDHLVVGRVLAQAGGYLVEFQLFDAVRGRQLIGYSIPTAADGLRAVAHQISDLIYEKLTGEPGAFNTFIAYVMAEGSGDDRRFKLAVADADGFNEQIILTSQQPLMSPAWSPDGKRLAYVSFEKGRSELFVQEVFSGKREGVAAFKGLNSAPAWSPDGRRLAMTLSQDGNPEIYILDLASRKLTRVTRHYAIDTEAVWAPDGNSLVFTSDRGGQPQLYRIAVDERGPVGRAERLTFEGSYNARAAFSPDGKRLTLIHGDGGSYRIAVFDLAQQTLQVVSNSELDESPSFAPNGAMIIFASEENNRGVLEAVSVDGRARQRLRFQGGDVREPVWSPFLQR